MRHPRAFVLATSLLVACGEPRQSVVPPDALDDVATDFSEAPDTFFDASLDAVLDASPDAPSPDAPSPDITDAPALDVSALDAPAPDVTPDVPDGCTPGATRPCYTGPAATAARGACRAGTQTCLPDRRWADVCTGEVLPTPERCNGVDDDCDGALDDGVTAMNCPLPNATTTCRMGACAVVGCTPGYGDCDGAPTNGCEAALSTTTDCGSCGLRCGTGQACVMGACVTPGGIDVSVGGAACALMPGGRVVCWGSNTFGRLGNGSMTDYGAPTFVTGLTDAVDVEAGIVHTCAIRAGGAVVCWGQGINYQLGDGERLSRETPVAVPGITDATMVALSTIHTCALLRGGRVVCWGTNTDGQIGDGTTAVRPVPSEVPGLADVVQITAGLRHTCALLRAGEVWCWGANAAGQLGVGDTARRLVPTRVAVANVTAVSASVDHTCALRADGTVACWGLNSRGQVGANGGGGNQPAPVEVRGLTDADQITTGQVHSCARRRGGTAVCWGDNNDGQLGDGTNAARTAVVAVSGLTSVAQIDGGALSTCARRTDGTVVCWGSGAIDELGDGRRLGRPTADRAIFGIPAGETCVGASCALGIGGGANHTCAIRPSGTVACWGANSNGVLGDGTTVARAAAWPAAGLSGVAQVTGGAAFTCVRLTSGAVRCWGANGSGQLGDGTTTASLVPVGASGVTDAEELVANFNHACARLRSGQVRCWGSNSVGELGDGSAGDRPFPTLVGGGASRSEGSRPSRRGSRTPARSARGARCGAGEPTTRGNSGPAPRRWPDGSRWRSARPTRGAGRSRA